MSAKAKEILVNTSKTSFEGVPSNLWEVLFEVAQETRIWAENTFNGTEELDCLCAICSYDIFKKLHKQGIDAWFVMNKGSSHCYVLVDETIVDVTATQFGNFPKVMVRNKYQLGGKGMWSVGRKAITDEKVRQFLKKWPKDQQPVFSC